MLSTEHIDSGEKIVLFDAMYRPFESRDEKQALQLNEFDEIGRQTTLWARDNDNDTVTLRQKHIYGDSNSSGLASPENTNHLGQLYKKYEDTGLATFSSYDFKGNVLERKRQVIADTELTQNSTFRVNWEGAGNDLESLEYISSIAYDAMNRIKTFIYPEDQDNKNKVLLPSYNQAGLLQSVSLKEDNSPSANIDEYVKHIAYNAKGQRILAAYGNNTMTRYLYNSQTFRLVRQQTEKYSLGISGNIHTYSPNGGKVQNHSYLHDLAGNIVGLKKRESDSGYGATPDQLDSTFTYDAMYRLLSATGRECNDVPAAPWDDRTQCTDPNNRRQYTQNYSYDKMGNIQQLQHIASSGSFTRDFTYTANKNLLDNIEIGANTFNFQFDDNGNQTQENSERFFEWDHADQLKFFKVDDGSTVSITEHYLYNSSGERIKKYTRKQNGDIEVCVYIDGMFEHRYKKNSSGTITAENNELHILDDSSRIARLRVGNAFLNDTTPSVVYNMEDHLGSSIFRLDISGSPIDREEYYPFGETSLHTFSKKRYRFCGKERDEHSGLYYYGARYYAAWTCRFTSKDPLAKEYANLSPYNYAGNKPVTHKDIDGLQGTGDSQTNQSDGSTGNENNVSVSISGGVDFINIEINESGVKVSGGPGLSIDTDTKGFSMPLLEIQSVKAVEFNAETGKLNITTENSVRIVTFDFIYITDTEGNKSFDVNAVVSAKFSVGDFEFGAEVRVTKEGIKETKNNVIKTFENYEKRYDAISNSFIARNEMDAQIRAEKDSIYGGGRKEPMQIITDEQAKNIMQQLDKLSKPVDLNILSPSKKPPELLRKVFEFVYPVKKN